MSVRVDPRLLHADVRIVAPPLQRACEDRTFGLFLAYLGIMGLGFMGLGFPHPQMILPMAIFAFFTAAFYVVPMLWATMQPAHQSKAMTFGELMSRGIDVETGHSSGGAVVAQVLVLPVLILLWGVAAVTIAALV